MNAIEPITDQAVLRRLVTPSPEAGPLVCRNSAGQMALSEAEQALCRAPAFRAFFYDAALRQALGQEPSRLQLAFLLFASGTGRPRIPTHSRALAAQAVRLAVCSIGGRAVCRLPLLRLSRSAAPPVGPLEAAGRPAVRRLPARRPADGRTDFGRQLLLQSPHPRPRGRAAPLFPACTGSVPAMGVFRRAPSARASGKRTAPASLAARASPPGPVHLIGRGEQGRGHYAAVHLPDGQ